MEEPPAANVDPGPVTQILDRLREGDVTAGDELLAVVQDELRRVAAALMRRQRKDHTLQPTALVNEAYLRLFSGRGADWNDRRHFLRAAATAMRCILVDRARARNAARRSGGRARITYEEWQHAAPEDVDVVAVHDALTALARIDPRGAHIVELRFFGGLTIEETARLLDVTERTVYRDWQAARLWLFEALHE